MKKIIASVFLIIFMLTLYYYREPLQNKFVTITSNKQTLNNGNVNQYARGKDFNFVQITNSVEPQNKEDLYNLYYTILDGGYKTYRFYCPKEYVNCLTDVNQLSTNDELLSDMNSFVAPYNTFKELTTNYNNYRLVSITSNPAYTKEQINVIEEKITSIENELIKPEMNTTQKIKTIHDFIINQTIYDKDRADRGIITYHSDIAYGPLFEGYGICSGYTDAMALFLDRWQIPNYRITSEAHVWNLVYIDGKWLHLDLTFDDPISADGRNMINHKYFLINNAQLHDLNDGEHNFDQNIFIEPK